MLNRLLPLIGKGLLVTVCSFLVLPLFALPGSPQGTGIITGRVTDKSGVSLPGASVKIKSTTKGVNTNQTGNYSFFNLDPGSYTVVVTYLGFADKELVATVSNDNTTTL